MEQLTENPGRLRRGDGYWSGPSKRVDLQKLLKMVLELRTEGRYFLGCDGGNRYDAKL